MKPRKVYKRANTIHVCFAGGHYAPESGVTRITTKDQVIVVPAPALEGDWVQVDTGDYTETWVRTVIGNDAQKAPRTPRRSKQGSQRPTRTKRSEPPTVTRKQAGQDGRPTMDEVDAMICAVAPSQLALGIMRACWENWYVSDRRLNLMQGLNYRDKDDTERVRSLGRELMMHFR